MIIKRGKKSQVSLEFIMFVGISFIILMLFVSSTTNKIIELNKEKEKKELEDIAHYIQAEIFMAYNSHDGYKRTFQIPTKIGDKPYSIEYDQSSDYDKNFIYISLDDNLVLLRVPPFHGNIKTTNQGFNTITKINGEINVTQA